MNVELSHGEAKSLFGALVDEELEEPQELSLRAHLDDCEDCRSGWQRYERVVKGSRGLERQKAPRGLASLILRRVRRRRFGARALHLSQVTHRVPVEVVIIPLIAAAVAALLFFVSR